MGITLSDLFSHLPQYELTLNLIENTPSSSLLPKPSSRLPQVPTQITPITPKKPSTAPRSSGSKVQTTLMLTAHDFLQAMDEAKVLRARKTHALMREPWPLLPPKLSDHVPKRKPHHHDKPPLASSRPWVASPTGGIPPPKHDDDDDDDTHHKTGTTADVHVGFFQVSCTLKTLLDLGHPDHGLAYPDFNDRFTASAPDDDGDTPQPPTPTLPLVHPARTDPSTARCRPRHRSRGAPPVPNVARRAPVATRARSPVPLRVPVCVSMAPLPVVPRVSTQITPAPRGTVVAVPRWARVGVPSIPSTRAAVLPSTRGSRKETWKLLRDLCFPQAAACCVQLHTFAAAYTKRHGRG